MYGMGYLGGSAILLPNYFVMSRGKQHFGVDLVSGGREDNSLHRLSKSGKHAR